MKHFYVYILSNDRGTIYTGVTNDLRRRVYEHQNKLVDGFTKRYNITRLIYFEESHDSQAAIAREKEIRGWRRNKKLALINTLNPTFRDLSADWSAEPAPPASGPQPPLFGGIEAGGTKFVCAVGSGPGDIRAETRFPTTTPDETLSRAEAFFREQQPLAGPLLAIGIAAFGPLDPNPASPSYGFITSTPKPGWADTDVVGVFRRAFDLPVVFDTDVNGAALGEGRWGAVQGLDTFLYLTIGTGIGGGGVVGGKVMHGLVHPEMGHIRLPHDSAADPFPGACPFHGDCFEGLAAGPAMEKRWGQKAETLPPDHPAWALEARYIALALADFVCTLSPQRIILGGGVMAQAQLFPLVRAETLRLLNGYVQSPAILQRIDEYIVPPGLGGRAGVLGALALAENSLKVQR